MAMSLISGKLVLHYIGEYGRHTELFIEDELVAAGFNCNKSIMLLLWCAFDSKNKLIDIGTNFKYTETELGMWLCDTIFKPQLFSKYDVLMTGNAAAETYHDMIYKKKYQNPIDVVLSAKRDLVLHVQKKFRIDNLEVIYELDEQEIWNNGTV